MNDIKRIATFDVDAQKGFTELCPDELPVPGGTEIVDALNYMATKGSIRVGSKDAHPANPVWEANESQPMLTPLDYPNADLAWNLHCVVGTKGFELLDGLPAVEDYDFFVYKGMEKDLHPYGACFHDIKETMPTGVVDFLKQKGVDTVIVSGLAYDHCVKTTALQLVRAGFTVYLYEPASRGIMEETCAVAKEEMEREGVVRIGTKEEHDKLFP